MTDDLKARSYSDAICLPYKKEKGLLSGGVIDNGRRFVDDTALHENYYDGSYEFDEGEVKHSDECAVFLGTWIGIYGHAITDNIKKLWYLRTDECRRLRESGCVLVYNYLGDDKELPGYMIDILDALNIPPDSLQRINHIIEYRKVIVPDNSLVLRDGGRSFTKGFLDTVNLIKDNSNPDIPCYKKIYLTRSCLKNRKDYNEKLIEDLFREKGFEVLSPEKFSFREQVFLMKNCEILATTEGSVSHNAVFCENDTRAIILRKANYCNGYQKMINAMRRLQVTYLDANFTIRRKHSNPWDGPFFLWPTEEVTNCLGVAGFKSHWLSLSWYRYLLGVFKSYLLP